MALDFLAKPDAFFNVDSHADMSTSITASLDANVWSRQLELPADVKGLQFVEAQKEEEAKLQASKQSLQSLQSLQSVPYGPSNYTHRANPGIKMNHGTTTMAFLFDAGVLVAVDSRASMGSYIGSGTVKKVIPISKYLLGTMAGGAADCSYWERVLAFECRLYQLREQRRISVAAASKLLVNLISPYRGYGLSMGTMVAGWDEVGGPALFYVDSDCTRLKGDRFCVGSGATYAYGVLDNEYRKDLTVEEAVELGKKAIWHATHRDAYSGGTINVFCITAEGYKQYYKGDMNELYYKQGYQSELNGGPIAGSGGDVEMKSSE